LHQKGIPVYPTPERGIRALYQLVRFDEAKPVKKASHAMAPAGALNLIPAPQAAALLRKYGIGAVDAKLAASPQEAVAMAKQFKAPVVLKIASPDISHKTDIGGVRLNLVKPSDVRDAYTAIIHNVTKQAPKAVIEGVTVSPMAEPGGQEVILGVTKDPQYGAVLMFGLGGIFTEIYKDVQFCLLPGKVNEYKQLIRGIKGYPLLAGVRGLKAKDEKALISLMQALSKLVKDHPEIDQIDLNPVLVYEQGLSVVDYRILTR
jgi:acetyltransferase